MYADLTATARDSNADDGDGADSDECPRRTAVLTRHWTLTVLSTLPLAGMGRPSQPRPSHDVDLEVAMARRRDALGCTTKARPSPKRGPRGRPGGGHRRYRPRGVLSTTLACCQAGHRHMAGATATAASSADGAWRAAATASDA